MPVFVFFDEFYQCGCTVKEVRELAIKDYWLYQKRNVATPWAIYFVKEYEKPTNDVTCIDFTLYHEDIPGDLHSKSFIGLKHDTPKGYADEIVTDMRDYIFVSSDDHAQIMQELERILA